MFLDNTVSRSNDFGVKGFDPKKHYLFFSCVWLDPTPKDLHNERPTTRTSDYGGLMLKYAIL